MTEQECQEILATLVKHEHLSRVKPPIKLTVKPIQQGRATEKNFISIPKWALTPYYHGVWYVVHEVAHITKGQMDWGTAVHGKEFKRKENRLLKLFGLSIKRNKAYPKIIYHNGVEVWHILK